MKISKLISELYIILKPFAGSLVNYEIREILSFVSDKTDIIDLIDIDDNLAQKAIALAYHREFAPLARLTKRTSFYGNNFIISDSVLEPRADTELLIELAISLKPKVIIDIGTGSGAIIISILRHINNAIGIGVDISIEALRCACVNAYDVRDRIEFVHANFLESVADVNADLIVSNPPYIKTNDIKNLEHLVKDFDPWLALDGGIDGNECYKAIASQISAPRVILEINNNSHEIDEIFSPYGYAMKVALKDGGDNVRVVMLEKE